MDVVSACPLRVASVVWQPRPGAFALTVVVLASYALSPGESQLAVDQEEPNEADGYWNDDERRSLHVASDLAPFKPRADVFLVGHAYAPGGEPVTSLVTRLLVGGIDKSIAVYGDRAFTPDGELRKPARFVRMPLRWERAAGGPYTANPVGIRADAPDAQGMIHVPNLQPPGARVAERGDVVDPIGYGPIAPTWPGRIARLGRHAAAWDHVQWNTRPLPGDIDPAYFNVAPPDQQLDELRAGERIALENLHPDHPRLLTTLAPAVPHGVIEREGGAPEPLRLRCDTLSIDADRGHCTLAWRGALALRHPYEAGRILITTEEAARSSRPVPSRLRDEVPDAPPMRRQHTVVGSQLVGAALPFVPSAGPPPSAPSQPPSPASAGSNAGLPFKPAAAAPPPAPAPAPPSGPPSRRTLPTLTEEAAPPSAGPQRLSNALPFVSSAHALSALSAPPAVLAQPARPAPPAPAPPPSRPAPPAPAPPPSWGGPPSPITAVPTPPVAPIAAPPLPVAPIAAPPPPPRPLPPADEPPPYYVAPQPLPAAPIAQRSAPPLPPPPPPLPSDEPPAPPPMLGPLATPDMDRASIEEVTEPLQPKAAAPAPAPDPARPPAPWVPPLDAYPLERCAAIAASIARQPEERAAILEANGLKLEQWRILDQHWADAILKETTRGRSKLLSAYDDAYVAQLEAERGPITVSDYARIVVAAERGEETPALAARGLPRAALLRIQRVWLRRTAGDATLAAAARKELEAAREEDG